MTVQQIYDQALRELSVSERLMLASRILNDIATENPDESDEWSDADLREFTRSSMRSLDTRLHGEGDAGLR